MRIASTCPSISLAALETSFIESEVWDSVSCGTTYYAAPEVSTLISPRFCQLFSEAWVAFSICSSWRVKQSKKCIALTLALTSPSPLLPLLTLSLTRSSPSLTHASPPTHPRWVRTCWRVFASQPSFVVRDLIREAILDSRLPTMRVDLLPCRPPHGVRGGSGFGSGFGVLY